MMNKQQKQILQSQLNNEQATLKKLKGIYKKALDDIDEKIAVLNGRTDTENLQSIIYQKQYQEALKQQISGILDTLNGEQFGTVSEYLVKSYEDGFIGTMYDLHGQGIPLIFPIDQNQVVKAVTHDSPLVEPFYNKLGEDVELLKKRVANNISRGFAQGQSYLEIAKNISRGMVGDYSKLNGGALYDAMRITRTEGHRITQQAAFDAQKKAKDNGADIVKQWDSTLDGRTRDSHARVDGEIRELDKKFSNGLMFPGDPHGAAAEVINCRCALLQRAKWALDDEELEILKKRAELFGLDKNDNFEEFKKKYLKTLDNNGNSIYNGNAISGQKKPFTKVKIEDIPPMDEKRFKRMKANLERNGVKVIQDSYADEFLKYMKAEALTLSDGSGIIFQSGRIPSASAMFEETIHVTQIRTKGMLQSTGDKNSTIEYLNREIEANRKVLKHKRQYGLTEKDVESVKENLEFYNKQMKEVNNNV